MPIYRATKRERVFRCQDCSDYITPERAQLYGICEECGQKHVDAWRAEHTRRSAKDKRPGWLIGDCGMVKLGGVVYEFKILDMSDRADGDYLLTKLELTKTVDVFGQKLKQTWMHPTPVQSYKLRKVL